MSFFIQTTRAQLRANYHVRTRMDDYSIMLQVWNSSVVEVQHTHTHTHTHIHTHTFTHFIRTAAGLARSDQNTSSEEWRRTRKEGRKRSCCLWKSQIIISLPPSPSLPPSLSVSLSPPLSPPLSLSLPLSGGMDTSSQTTSQELLIPNDVSTERCVTSQLFRFAQKMPSSPQETLLIWKAVCHGCHKLRPWSHPHVVIGWLLCFLGFFLCFELTLSPFQSRKSYFFTSSWKLRRPSVLAALCCSLLDTFTVTSLWWAINSVIMTEN